MKTLAAAVLLAVSLAPRLGADEVTKPIRYTWIVTSCETWNCAAAALILANGDRNVIALPTTLAGRPWMVLRRVEEGSIYIPEGEPFSCDVYDTVSEATSRFTSMDACREPTILNVPDGRVVITSLQKCGSSKQRAVR